jgi:hypothetical protein
MTDDDLTCAALLNEIRRLRAALQQIADLDFNCGPDGCGLFRAEEIACEALG